MKIMHVVGARPNFPKIAPIMAEMAKSPDRFQQVLVHTGQHYDYNMSQVFFEHLDMPAPNEYLNVGSGSHAAQTAMVMTACEPVLLKHRPDWVLVAGDVNSTLACALVCAKLPTRSPICSSRLQKTETRISSAKAWTPLVSIMSAT
jgi:UDP-N-acetylglucosamine 2-epimerase (non-hydrolysing)